MVIYTAQSVQLCSTFYAVYITLIVLAITSPAGCSAVLLATSVPLRVQIATDPGQAAHLQPLHLGVCLAHSAASAAGVG